MRGQVQGEVERADGRNRADWEAADDAGPAARGGVQVEWNDLAADSLGLLGSDAKSQHRPVHLAQSVADRLSGLRGDKPADLLAPCGDAGADHSQRPAPLEGRQPASLLECGHGRGDGLIVLIGRGVVRPAGRFVGARRVLDPQPIRRIDPPAGEVEEMRLGSGGRGHGRSPSSVSVAPANSLT